MVDTVKGNIGSLIQSQPRHYVTNSYPVLSRLKREATIGEDQIKLWVVAESYSLVYR